LSPSLAIRYPISLPVGINCLTLVGPRRRVSMAGPLSFISTASAVVRSRLVGRIGRRRARLDAYTPLCDTLIEPSRRRRRRRRRRRCCCCSQRELCVHAIVALTSRYCPRAMCPPLQRERKFPPPPDICCLPEIPLLLLFFYTPGSIDPRG